MIIQLKVKKDRKVYLERMALELKVIKVIKVKKVIRVKKVKKVKRDKKESLV